MLLAPFPSDDLGQPDVFEPRPAPERIDLFLEETVRRLQFPADAMRNFQKFREETKELGDEIVHRVKAMTHSARSGWFVNATETPLNRRIGPNRRIAHLVTDLDRVKAVKNGLGGTVNDVVIAAVAGAVRSFLLEDRGLRRRRRSTSGRWCRSPSETRPGSVSWATTSRCGSSTCRSPSRTRWSGTGWSGRRPSTARTPIRPSGRRC